MHKIINDGKRVWLAGWETAEKKDIVQYNIYSWAIGAVKYDDEMGCMFIVSRIKKSILAVVYMHKEEFLRIQKSLSEHFKKFPAYGKYSFGEQWEFSMMKVRNTVRKMSA